MTDRELLELAARSAGIELWQDVAGNYYRDPKSPVIWNPLADDGDALRLAVKLGFKIVHWVNNTLNKLVSIYKSQESAWPILFERYDEDPYAATRRAIVRAAAER